MIEFLDQWIDAATEFVKTCALLFAIGALLFALLLAMAGCQTVSGIGRDITAASDGVATECHERSGR